VSKVTLQIDPFDLATAVFVVEMKIQEVERQRRVFPDALVTAEQAKIRADHLLQLTDCLKALSTSPNAKRNARA
jgi:hypothetical protein